MATVTALVRVFLYNSRQLPDPDSSLTPAQVKDFYTAIHPELVNAAVEGGEFDGDRQTFSFVRGIGTKG